MSTLGNILWFLCGGIIMAFLWFLIGILMLISIIGIPWARACFVIAKFNLCPFGRELISRNELTGKSDLGTGPLGLLGNIIWFILAGWWLALSHVIAACISAVTIIGIPFAIQHLKLAATSVAPIGKTIVKKHLAAAARMQDAHAQLSQIRGASINVPESPRQVAISTTTPSLAQLPPSPKLKVARGENVLGEFTESEIQHHVASGFLETTDWFWDAEVNDWKALSELK